jgi:hypothetical protein
VLGVAIDNIALGGLYCRHCEGGARPSGFALQHCFILESLALPYIPGNHTAVSGDIVQACHLAQLGTVE